MAFFANYPFALAPGMGLNAFFTYSVVFGMRKSWQFALTAVFIRRDYIYYFIHYLKLEKQYLMQFQ